MQSSQKVGKFAIIQGDIIVEAPEGKNTKGAATFANSLGKSGYGTLWPGGVIPFIIDSTVQESSRIISAINHFQSATSIRFVGHKNEKDYVRFIGTNEDYCRSWVGRMEGQQELEIAHECSIPRIIHELGHVVGLLHEHNRPDRDSFITVYPENSKYPEEFDLVKGFMPNYGKFDFNSIMLYPAYKFSKNGLPTMVRRSDGSTQGFGVEDYAKGLSDGDRSAITYLYSGNAKYSPNNCGNSGSRP